LRARALASRPAKVDRLFGDGLGRRSGAIGLDHHQARVVEEFLRLYLRFLVPRFLAPRLFVPQFFASWFVTPRFFMARLRVHRLGVLRLLLALRLELMDAPLRLDHGRVDMRRRRVTALATPIAIAIASAAAAPPARVAGIELRLPPGEDAAAVLGLLAVAVGDPLSTRALRRTLQRLYQTGRYRQLTFLAVPADPPPGQIGLPSDAAAAPEWVTLLLEAEAARRVASLGVRRGEGPAVLESLRARCTWLAARWARGAS